MKSNWNYPTTVWAGENRVNDISDACLVSKIKNYKLIGNLNYLK